MIFQHTHADVLSGAKKQTRRPHKKGDKFQENHLCNIVNVTRNGRTLWQVGRTYAVQEGRGKPAVARIRLLEIALKSLNNISDEDIQAEGFASRDEFVAAWDTMHHNAAKNPIVWVLVFSLV